MDEEVRQGLLRSYRAHAARFDAIAARRASWMGTAGEDAKPIQPRGANRLNGTPRSKGVVQLSDREIDVLRLISQGLSNREIAVRLALGEETVKTHVQRILRRLEVRNRAHAVAVALENDVMAA